MHRADYLAIHDAPSSLVAVAQLVESWIVIPVVVGSSPIGHPKNISQLQPSYLIRLIWRDSWRRNLRLIGERFGSLYCQTFV